MTPWDQGGGRGDLVEIEGELKAETDKAVLLHDGARTVWLPKLQIEVARRPRGLVEIAMPKWLAKAKGLI